MKHRIEYNKENYTHGGDYIFVDVNEYRVLGKNIFTKITGLPVDRIIEIDPNNYYDSNGDLIEEN